eukprot:12913702-Prorocentrum_lima.AAC.1
MCIRDRDIRRLSQIGPQDASGRVRFGRWSQGVCRTQNGFPELVQKLLPAVSGSAVGLRECPGTKRRSRIGPKVASGRVRFGRWSQGVCRTQNDAPGSVHKMLPAVSGSA